MEHSTPDPLPLQPPAPAQGAGRLLLRSTRLALVHRGLADPAISDDPSPAAGLSRQQAQRLLQELLGGGPAAPRHPAPPPAWSPPALAGLLAAAQTHCLAVDSTAPVVVMASAGGPRHLPVLTPLLALWLAREGVRVLLHGPLSDPSGVTSAEVLRNLGLAPTTQVAEVHQAWSRREPAFMATSTLCPAIAPLLEHVHGTAWRSLARRLVRLLDPVTGAPSLRVAHQGSHDTGQLLARWAAQEGAAVMLLRGADGEPVVDLRRRPRIDTWLGGQRQPRHSCAAQAKDLAAPPLWPQHADAATTALYAQTVLSGERPAPSPLAAQVSLILNLMPRLGLSPGQG